MNGQKLTQGIMQAQGEELRMIYSLLCKTNIISMITAKTKDIFTKDTDHFTEALKNEVKLLNQYTDEQVQLMLFTELTRMLQIKGTHYDLPLEIETQGELIMQETHQLMMKEDKNYKLFVESAKDREIYQLMVQYQMQKVFSTFDAKFRELDEKDSLAFLHQIEAFLNEMPTQKQAEFKKKLNIDDITNETLRQALLTQGSVVVLSIIVEIAGFAAYTTLTSAIAATMALLGVTLPFGVYTFATSLLSIIVNPLFLIPLVLGGGGLLLSRQNKNLKNKLLPIGILQLILPISIQQSEKKVSYDSFIQEWQLHSKQQKLLLEEQANFEQEIALLEHTLADHQVMKAKSLSIENEMRENINEQKKLISEAIFSIPEYERSDYFQTLVNQIEVKNEAVHQLQQQIQKNKEQHGFWNTINATLDNAKLTSQTKKIQQEITDIKKQLVSEFLALTNCSVLQTERNNIRISEVISKNQRAQIKLLSTLCTGTQNEIDRHKKQLTLSKDQLIKLQEQCYGLAHLV